MTRRGRAFAAADVAVGVERSAGRPEAPAGSAAVGLAAGACSAGYVRAGLTLPPAGAAFAGAGRDWGAAADSAGGAIHPVHG